MHTILLQQLAGPDTLIAYVLQQLQPIAAAASFAVVFHAARSSPPGSRFRAAWMFTAAGIIFSIVGMFAQSITSILDHDVLLSPISLVCFLGYYVCLAVGLAHALPTHPGRVGMSIARLMLGGGMMGLLVLLITTEFLLPQVPITLPVVFFVLDVGLLYAVGTLALRYRQHAMPLIALLLSSVVSLVAASAIWALFLPTIGAESWSAAVMPLYTIHRGLLALAITRSLSSPPRLPTRIEAMSRNEWALWVVLPHSGWIVLAAIFFLEFQTPSSWIIGSFLIIASLRQIWVEIERRWDELALDAARRQQEQSAQAASEALRDRELAYIQLQQAQEDTDQFARQIAHDFSTPVQNMVCILDSLSIRKETTVQHTDIDALWTEISLLQTFTEEIREYLRVRQHGLSCQPVALWPLCLETVRSFQSRADQAGVSLLPESDGNPMVWAEETALQRILYNLLSNAFKFTRPGDTITVRVTNGEDPSRIVLSVQDTGPGIPPDKLSVLFCEGVTNVHQHNGHPQVFRVHPGLGIGLAIVHELAARMRASCVVSSTLQEGTCFSVILQRVDASHLESCPNSF
jgi:signal transduction histidine kinase